MKVYSHFTNLNNTEGLRWGTILQFGDSWDIIGSVVMKNPGSSACGGKVSDVSILENLKLFQSPDDDWYEFSPDDTMRKVAMLFQYKEGVKNIDSLNGVILIFNLFHYREADLNKAIQKNAELKITIDFISNEISQLKPPIYLGFGDLAFDKRFTNRARAFYEKAMALGMKCYDSEFYTNKFPPPQYLMGVGKNQKPCIEMLAKFTANNLALSEDEINAAASFMQNEPLSISDWDVLFCLLCEWMSVNQSFLKTELNPKNAEITQLTWARFHISKSCAFQLVRQKGYNQFVRFELNDCSEDIFNYLKNSGYNLEAKCNSPQRYKKDRRAFNNNIYYAILEIFNDFAEIRRRVNQNYK